MKRILISGILLLMGSEGYSQKQKDDKVSFTSVTQFGIQSGSLRDALVIQTINGVTVKSMFAGIGVGIDNYNERSIPLFIGIQKSFGNRINVPFVYADGGVNFGWMNALQKQSWSSPEYRQPSWYYDAGIGWKIALKNESDILMSAGYSLKQLKGDRRSWSGPVIGGQRMETREYFENTYRRLVIKLGIQL